MALVIGTNTYVDDAEYVAFSTARGRTVGADATVREQELILAMDYLESHRAQFQGTKATQEQALQWPRSPVYIDGYFVGNDVIPQELKNAQMEAAAIANSESLLKTGATSNVQSETVDVVSVTYFSGGSWEKVRMDTVNIFLLPLLNSGSFGINARVIRA